MEGWILTKRLVDELPAAVETSLEASVRSYRARLLKCSLLTSTFQRSRCVTTAASFVLDSGLRDNNCAAIVSTVSQCRIFGAMLKYVRVDWDIYPRKLDLSSQLELVFNTTVDGDRAIVSCGFVLQLRTGKMALIWQQLGLNWVSAWVTALSCLGRD